MKDITDKEYNEVELFYKNMGFKNLREYLKSYLTSDITLLADVFNILEISFLINFNWIVLNIFLVLHLVKTVV